MFLVVPMLILLVIGIRWDEVSLNEAGVVVAIWCVCLTVCLSLRLEPRDYWIGVPTLFLNAYLVLKIFKSDPEIPRPCL